MQYTGHGYLNKTLTLFKHSFKERTAVQCNWYVGMTWYELGFLPLLTNKLANTNSTLILSITVYWKRSKRHCARLFEGLDGGYKCQLSVKISVICQLSVKFSAFCQLSVKWLLMINNETYLNIFDIKFGLKGTYNAN